MTRRKGGTEDERRRATLVAPSAGGCRPTAGYVDRARPETQAREISKGLVISVPHPIHAAQRAAHPRTPFVLRLSVAPCRSASSAISICLSAWLVLLALAALQATGAGQQASAPAGSQSSASTSAAGSVRPVLDQYCVTCHNKRLRSGDLALD